MPDEPWLAALYSLAPTVLVGGLFWFIMRSIIRADRTERSAFSKIEAEERARAERERTQA